jgi:hypothetical protein
MRAPNSLDTNPGGVNRVVRDWRVGHPDDGLLMVRIAPTGPPPHQAMRGVASGRSSGYSPIIH